MSRRVAVPGPFRRLLRERGRAAAVILVAVSALAVAGIQGGAAAALRSSLDANWRGAYDILVVPADAPGAIDGMLPPNSLATGVTGLSFDDLEAVRDVDGVGIAAPIGEIIVPALKPVLPAIAIPPSAVDASAAPQAYRLDVTYTTDDGLGERVVASSRSEFIIEESTAGRAAPQCEPVQGQTFNDIPVDVERYPALADALYCGHEVGDGVYTVQGSTWGYAAEDNGVYAIMLENAPQSASRITLVDPAAEKALLGDAGGFLDPLIAFAPTAEVNTDDMLAWAQADSGPYGQAFLDDRVADSGLLDFFGEAGMAELRQLYADQGRDFDAEMAAERGAELYLPLLVADAPSAQLSVKVAVSTFGEAVFNGVDGATPPYSYPASMTDDAVGAPVGTVVADISGALNPLVDDRARIAWPGADLDAAEQLPDYNSLGLSAVARPVDARYATVDGLTMLQPSGYRSPHASWFGGENSSSFDLGADPMTPGNEAAYVGLEKEYADGVDEASPLAVPIGSFSSDGIDSADAADYVPLGAYAPVDSTITGGEMDGTVMEPSVTGLGLVSPRTIAIGSLASAAVWGAEAPISAIRVRVDGITGYSPEAQQKVVDVAQQLQELGFRAVVVAGSSPSPVIVQVDGYAFGVESTAEVQSVGPLGEITQRWSELGAAARAELAISDATLAIAIIGVGSSIVLLGAVQLAGIPRRRGQTAAMRELGFTRPRIARWFAAEELPGVAVIAVVATAAVLLSGSALTLIVLAVVVGVALALGATAVAVGSRPMSGPPQRVRRSRRTGARTVGAFGVRQAWLHPVTTLTQLVAIVIVGAAAAALVAVFLRGRSQAGASLLAGLLGDQQFLPQLALGLTAIAAGIALALLGRRLELSRRADQWSTLRSSGWTSRQIARAQRSESIAIIVPSLLLAVGVVIAGTQLLEVPQPWALTAAGAVAASVAAVVTLTARTRGIRP